MSIIVNAIKDKNIISTKSCTKFRNNEALSKLAKNSASNIDLGSKTCPLVSECRDVGEGVVQGDFKKVA